MICKDCNLIIGNKNNGFRFGNTKAKFIILRAYPTRQECNGIPDTKQNIWLINQLHNVGFTEDMYHIVNMINCYPVRTVTKDEIDICTPKLIKVVNGTPKVIMTIGVEAYNYASGYNIKAIEQVKSSMVTAISPPVIANYTVGQAMHNKEIKQRFIKILYKTKSFYRLKIDINI